MQVNESVSAEKDDVVVVTGAAGFIASCMVGYLNQQGYNRLILVDDFLQHDRESNWSGKSYEAKVNWKELWNWLEIHHPKVSFFIHMGANTDTTEFDYALHKEMNLDYTKKVWSYCTENAIPLIYASSAATYGAGELGYNDSHEIVEKLKPLNPYGISKNEFDKWMLAQSQCPPFWAGLKFFNVYGPNEYHKGRMSSVILHAFEQIKQRGYVELFRSHRPDFKDGEQLRDFVYVKDLVLVMFWMVQEALKGNKVQNGLYNIGTGKARSFNDLVKATFHGLDLVADIHYIDMPLDIRDKYQYYTQAPMEKLRSAGYTKSFYSLEEGVEDYVRNYLKGNKHY